MKTIVLCLAIALASLAMSAPQQPALRLRVVTLGSPLLAGGHIYEVQEGDVVEVNDRKFRVAKGVRIPISSKDHVRLIRRQDGKAYDVDTAPQPATPQPGEFVGPDVSVVHSAQTARVPALPSRPQVITAQDPRLSSSHQITVDHDGNLSIGPNRDVQFTSGTGGDKAPIMIAQAGWLYIYDNGRAYKVRQSDMKLVAMTDLGPDALVAPVVAQPALPIANQRKTKHRSTRHSSKHTRHRHHTR